jgi:hypothetical protein
MQSSQDGRAPTSLLTWTEPVIPLGVWPPDGRFGGGGPTDGA